MSNRVIIIASRFTNLDEEDDPNATSYGFRAFDDFEMTYCNAMTEEEARQSDLGLLGEIVTHYADRPFQAMFDFLAMNKRGIQINGAHYEWQEIKEILAV